MARKFTGKKLLIASNNQNKIDEIKYYFDQHRLDIKLVTPKELSIDEPEETEETFQGNAELKARYYGKLSGIPALADDTGVCVEALGGLPGVHTAMWAGPNKDFRIGMTRIQRELNNVGCKDKLPIAHCVCVLSMYWPEDDHMESFEGIIYGSLNFDLSDAPGFGFQPIFVPKGAKKSFGLMSQKERDEVGNHRIKAFNKLLKSCFS
jgi:XTP/dITP diphosphohydrolase